MHTLANEERRVDTVTVEPGSETKFYFIPITNVSADLKVCSPKTDFDTSCKRVPISETYGSI